MKNEDGLQELRDRLDSIDDEILKLLNERMETVHQVGLVKLKVVELFIALIVKNLLSIDFMKVHKMQKDFLINQL